MKEMQKSDNTTQLGDCFAGSWQVDWELSVTDGCTGAKVIVCEPITGFTAFT